MSARAIDLCEAPGAAPRPEQTARYWAALEGVNDPELPISLVDLGLIYDVRVASTAGGPEPEGESGVRVIVDLTFTAMGCPCTAFIRQDIHDALMREPGVDAVEIVEVWDPPWRRARMTDRGRELMRKFGVAA